MSQGGFPRYQIDPATWQRLSRKVRLADKLRMAIILDRMAQAHRQLLQQQQSRLPMIMPGTQVGTSPLFGTLISSSYNPPVSASAGWAMFPGAPQSIRLWNDDPDVPDVFGWRAWLWLDTEQVLVSPHQMTPWLESILSAENYWDDEATHLRGAAGIHARRVPKKWRQIGWPDGDGSGGLQTMPFLVTGIVERFGKYVLGTQGWRAEKVIIREVLVRDTGIGLGVEKRYPDVVVHYVDQVEGEAAWTSVKSLKSESAMSASQYLASQCPAPPPPAPRLPRPNRQLPALSSPSSLTWSRSSAGYFVLDEKPKVFPFNWLGKALFAVSAGWLAAQLIHWLLT